MCTEEHQAPNSNFFDRAMMARSRKLICILARVCGFGNIHKDTDRDTSETLSADREIHARIHALGHIGLARCRVHGGQDTKLKVIILVI